MIAIGTPRICINVVRIPRVMQAHGRNVQALKHLLPAGADGVRMNRHPEFVAGDVLAATALISAPTPACSCWDSLLSSDS